MDGTAAAFGGTPSAMAQLKRQNQFGTGAANGFAPLWKAGAYFFTVPLNSVSISHSAAGGASI